jgi:hypothetical protein
LKRRDIVDQVATTDAVIETLAELAQPQPKAKPKKKRAKAKRHYRYLRRRISLKPGEREWRVWSHDFDAAYEALLKNPGVLRLTPKQLIARCEKIADAYAEMQTRRCPKGVERGF